MQKIKPNFGMLTQAFCQAPQLAEELAIFLLIFTEENGSDIFGLKKL